MDVEKSAAITQHKIRAVAANRFFLVLMVFSPVCISLDLCVHSVYWQKKGGGVSKI